MAAAFAAVFVGHQLGGHVAQSNASLQTKNACPSDDRLAAGTHPWTGWRACARHSRTAALTRAAAYAVVGLAAPLTVAGAGSALLVSAVSHVVIDRHWLVEAILRAKRCHDWADGPYLIEGSLHHSAHSIAAVIAATFTTAAGAAITGAASAVTIVAALGIERRQARTAAGRIGDPYRL